MKNPWRRPGFLGASAGIPQANAAIGGSGGKQTAIGAVGKRVYRRMASIPHTQGSSPGEEPGIDFENVKTPAGTGKNLAVRSKHNTSGISEKPEEGKRFFSADGVPKLEQSLVVARK